ncbi:MAG: putative toxin-antitoxin system toxin component, PIN family [Clostridia bacterium]|nr:putative toxin-antitoxin system toxin component, PIN family [Clostridia bacterium]
MKYYAAIDTNVVVSAMLKWNSVPGNVLELVFHGLVIPILNDKILNEYEEVLNRPKFHFTKEIIQPVIDGIKKSAVFVDEKKMEIELPDPKDIVFYEVVMQECEDEDAYLVTGNIKHFPARPYIVTPRQFIDIILGDIKD